MMDGSVIELLVNSVRVDQEDRMCDSEFELEEDIRFVTSRACSSVEVFSSLCKFTLINLNILYVLVSCNYRYNYYS